MTSLVYQICFMIVKMKDSYDDYFAGNINVHYFANILKYNDGGNSQYCRNEEEQK